MKRHILSEQSTVIRLRQRISLPAVGCSAVFHCAGSLEGLGTVSKSSLSVTETQSWKWDHKWSCCLHFLLNTFPIYKLRMMIVFSAFRFTSDNKTFTRDNLLKTSHYFLLTDNTGILFLGNCCWTAALDGATMRPSSAVHFDVWLAGTRSRTTDLCRSHTEVHGKDFATQPPQRYYY